LKLLATLYWSPIHDLARGRSAKLKRKDSKKFPSKKAFHTTMSAYLKFNLSNSPWNHKETNQYLHMEKLNTIISLNWNKTGKTIFLWIFSFFVLTLKSLRIKVSTKHIDYQQICISRIDLSKARPKWRLDGPALSGPSIVFTCQSCLCKSLSPLPNLIIGQ